MRALNDGEDGEIEAGSKSGMIDDSECLRPGDVCSGRALANWRIGYIYLYLGQYQAKKEKGRGCNSFVERLHFEGSSLVVVSAVA
jgi:hypothetical protein